MRTPVQIKGISTTSSYTDGDCLSMSNLRHEQGVLKPVENFPVAFTLKNQYTVLYYHKNNNYTNLLGIRNGSVYLIKNSGAENESEEFLIQVTGTATISHIGNVVNILDENRVIKYLYWQNGEYYAIDLNNIGVSDEIKIIVPELENIFTDNVLSVQRTEHENIVNPTYSVTNLSEVECSLSIDERDVGINMLHITCTLTEPAESDLEIPFKLNYIDSDGVHRFVMSVAFVLTGATVGVTDATFDDLGIDNGWIYSEGISGAQIEITVSISLYQQVRTFNFVLYKNNTIVETYKVKVPSVMQSNTEYFPYRDYDRYEVTYASAPNQEYYISLENEMPWDISGVLHVVKNGTTTNTPFTITNGKDITIWNYTTYAPDSYSVTTSDIITKQRFRVLSYKYANTDVEVTYKVTDNTNSTEHTLVFNILANTNTSESYIDVKCSSNITSVLDSIVYDPIHESFVVDIIAERRQDVNGKKVMIAWSDSTTPYHDDDQEIIAARKKLASGIMNKAISKIHDNGHIVGYCLACVAIELYDGSYINVSEPVFLGMASDKGQRYENYVIADRSYSDTFNYIDKPVLCYPILDGNLETHEEVCMNLPVGYNDGKKVVLGNMYEFGNFCATTVVKGTNDMRMVAGCLSNELKVKIRKTIDAIYKNIIKSLSVFITPEIYLHDTSEDSEYIGNLAFTNLKLENYLPKRLSVDEIASKIKESQTFYKVAEFSFDEINSNYGNWVSPDLRNKLGDNLLVQEELVFNAFSNVKASGNMVYNSMLHAWDITNVMTRGSSIQRFYPIDSAGQFEAAEYESDGLFWWIKTEIGTGENNVTIVRSMPYSGQNTVTLKGLSPLLTFPDSRATRMTVFVFDVSDWNTGAGKVYQKTFALTAHDSGLFAYYLDPNLKPIELSFNTVATSTDNKVLPIELNSEVSYMNKLKVSNTNNPFLFPDTQTYQIGDGKILNVASQSIRTSDGQFGQYPLVCFCTDGVYTLQVGDGTVAYSRVGTPQNYERPISKVICTTPEGIFFISNRGLCVVAGQEVILLSEAMFEKFRGINLETVTEITGKFEYDTTAFNDYLSGCTEMVYNPREKEVVIINHSKSFNYIYNLTTKQFYTNTEQISGEIQNSLPDLKVWYEDKVKTVTNTVQGTRNVSFITRPFKSQTPDFKRFERIIIRSYLNGLNNAVACVWGSIDDKNFKLLRGIVLTDDTTRKDIDFGLFGKTTYRSYIVGLSMDCVTDSEIEAIEMEISKEYDNTKMR